MRLLLGGAETLASLKLAVLVIAASAFVLGWATFVEREYGTAAVHFGIYGTWWFAGLLGLLGLNVLSAALIRFPWKKHQTGFVITHAGIILLLIGCLQSRLGGIDAQLPIFEADTGHVAFEDKQHFELRIEPTGPAGGRDNLRRSRGGKLVRIPFTPGPFNWRDYSADLVRWPWQDDGTLFWFPWRLAYRDFGPIYRGNGLQLSVLDYLSDSQLRPASPHDRSGASIVPVPFDKKKDKVLKQRRVRLRLSIDGHTETAWLDGLPMIPAELLGPSFREGQQWTVQGKDRRVKIRLVWDEIDTGFRLYLHHFDRRLDPGTSQPSHYSSLVSRLPPESAAEVEARRSDRAAAAAEDRAAAAEAEKISITLNEPVNFADPRTGLSYRMYQESFQGPFRPGNETFDELAGPTDRDELWESVLTVNYDPGRGLKYFGCLLVVAGIATMFYMRAYFFRPASTTETRMNAKIAIGALIFLASLGAVDALAEPVAPALAEPVAPTAPSAAAGMDWSAWKHIPVFDNGRIMPVNTFAMSVVETVCGTESPTLALVGTADGQGQEPESLAAAKVLFPDGKPRRFTAPELLLSWLVEPQRWESVPFLQAGHEGLRRDVLGLPIAAKAGRLKYVSPWQVMRSEGFRKQMLAMAESQALADKRMQPAKFTAVEEKTKSLFDAISMFRLVAYDPRADFSAGSRFDDRLTSLARTWQDLGPGVREMAEIGLGDRLREAVDATGKSIVKLVDLAQKQELTPKRAEPILVVLERSSAVLAQQLAEVKRVSLAGSPGGILPKDLDAIRTRIHALAANGGDLARQARQAHYALYDTGHAPAPGARIGPGRLGKEPRPQRRHPALARLSDADLRLAGRAPGLSARPAPTGPRELPRGGSGLHRPRQSPEAGDLQRGDERLCRLAGAVGASDRAGAEGVAHPAAGRRSDKGHGLSACGRHRDRGLLQRSRSVLLVVGGEFRGPDGLRPGPGRLPQAAALDRAGDTPAGPGLHDRRHGPADRDHRLGPGDQHVRDRDLRRLGGRPVGDLVRLAAAELAGPEQQLADDGHPRLLRGHAAGAGADERWRRKLLSPGRTGLLLPRMALAAGLVYLLAFKSYGYGKAGTLIAVWPRMDVGTSLPTVQNLLVWAVGLCMACLAAWVLPRLALSLALGVANVPYTLWKQGFARPLAEVVARKSFLLAARASHSLPPTWPTFSLPITRPC